ncbi:MAG: hypothetical protein IAC69_03145 [Proteobacteria bacterium]|uniref:Uncharacterized protein n=1 Tax=Candidatus Enterousia avistercoris TaxID=2840788 RepID=A0A9D9GSD3_9PROT|nr:hypothetical protein [Candidatus Enterousia avistercoris]
MKKLSLFAVLGLLAACTDGGTPSGAYGRPDGLRPGGNPQTNPNSSITQMTTITEKTVNGRVAAGLAEYPGATTSDNYLAVAEMVFDLGNLGDDADPDIVRQAMYIVSPELYSACKDNPTSGCISWWRAKGNNESLFNENIKDLQSQLQVLTPDMVEFAAPDATLKFSVDENTGKITGITVSTGADSSMKFDRGTGNTFTNDVATLTYDSYKPNSDQPLTYADFGMYKIEYNNGITPSRYAPFAGGYNDKKIAVANIETDMSFRGRAVGVATNGTDTVNLDGGATLHFYKNTARSGLNAQFNNWYTVNIQQSATDDTNATFTFFESGDRDIEGPKLSNINDAGVPNGTGTMNVGYYGNGNTPIEAAGIAHFEEGIENGVKLDLSFGVKKLNN